MYPYDNVTLTTGKSNLHPLQPGDDPTKWVTAPEDWNPAMQALADLQGALMSARFFGFGDGSAQANSASGKARLRYNPSNGAHGALEVSLDGQNYVALGGAGADGKTIYSGSGVPGGGLGVNGDLYIDTTNNLFYGPKAAGAWGSGVSLVGPSGRTILNGTSAPSNGTGANGDFFINTATTTIYGPKAAGAWPAGVSLIGATGANGTNGTNGTNGASGNTVRSGAGVPSGGLGVDGDWYINTSALTIYGPKTSGAWGSPTSIVGAAGTNGTNGTNGSNGAAGTNGTNGTDGKTIRNGTGVPSGGLGVDGDFYYDTSGIRFYGPKTSGAWGAGISLVGSAGAAGTNGTDGKTILSGSGAPSNGSGANGDFYVDLANARFYGPKSGGVWSAFFSLLGPSGAAGTNGTNGTNGFTILNGTTAPSGGTGVNGDFYIDKVAWFIYGPKAGGSWPAGVSIVGPQGPQGAAGPTVTADWADLLYVAIDNDIGLDVVASGRGTSTASMAAAGVAPWRSWEFARATLPKYGAGRRILVAIMARAGGANQKKMDGVTDDNLVVDWMGYADWEIRAVSDWTNSAASQRQLGGTIAQVGPNGDGSWTVAAGSSTSSINETTGTIPSGGNGMRGYRARFVSGLMTDESCGIHSNSSGQLVPMEVMSAAPAAGATFKIEKPGVAFASVKISALSMETASNVRPRIVGIRSTGAAGWQVREMPGRLEVAFCAAEGAGAFTVDGLGDLKMNRSWTLGDGTSIDRVGPSFTTQQHFDVTRVGNFIGRAMAALGANSSLLTLVHNGSVFRHSIARAGIAADSCGLVASGMNIGGGAASTGQRLVVYAAGSIDGGIRITSTSGTLGFADITNQGAHSAVLCAGTGPTIDIHDVTGSSGNTGAGIGLNFIAEGKILLGLGAVNTVTGTAGDILLHSGVIAKHADVAVNSFMDLTNRISNGGLAAPSPSQLVVNLQGAQIFAGSAVFVYRDGSATCSVRLTDPTDPDRDRVDGFMVTSPLDNGAGYMVSPLSIVAADFDGVNSVHHAGDPMNGDMAYLSETVPGRLSWRPYKKQVGRVSVQAAAIGGGHHHWVLLGGAGVDPDVYGYTNEGSVTLAKGTPVRIFENATDRESIRFATGDTLANAQGFVGVTLDECEVGENVAVAFGGVRDVKIHTNGGPIPRGKPVWLDREPASYGTTIPSTDDNQHGSLPNFPIGTIIGDSTLGYDPVFGVGYARVRIVPIVFDTLVRFPTGV